ncbi:uncharacterized protein TNCV_591151 [Trichonephila clavipes]|nr:uncharacterized protein TNCV_591151 [Trichonephila clavipes]
MILWKNSVDGPVQTCKLNTVTYGTTYAPYLATRTIQQLTRDEGEHYPLAASVTIRDIYMDDILTEWDEPLSNPIAKEWSDFVSTFPVIQNIHVPRLVIGKGRIIIYGFADASTAVYGAVLYVQSISEDDVSTGLLCSKSRVAPVKPITIPRLELCACVLLPQLLEKVLHSLTLPIQQIMLWIDSNIVLELTKNCQLNHVSSNENPADLISRGLNASDISSKQLWWYGPDFLKEDLEVNPIVFERITPDSDYLKELKQSTDVLLTSCKFSLIDDLSKRSNNYTKLLNILSYIFRFLHNSRNPSVKRSGQLDYSEVNEAELYLIKILQASAFQEEIEYLAKGGCNSKKGKLFSLNPFLDGNQILRVGGHLQNSDLTYSQKHPAILPADHLLTKLIMINIHCKEPLPAPGNRSNEKRYRGKDLAAREEKARNERGEGGEKNRGREK